MSDFQVPVGTTFISPDEIGANDLSPILRKTVAFIQALSPYTKLERYDDWWEHDGLHFFRKHISFDDVFEIVRSPKSLLESMTDEFNVFVGIYSKELAIYLRIYVEWNDDETEIIGRFDVTFPVNFAGKFRDEITSVSSIEMTEMNSDDYYKSIIC